MANRTGLLKHDLAAALGATQQELADVLGISRRTVQRLDKDLWALSASARHRAAIAVYPKDPELAAELAAGAHTTLHELGLVQPPRPPEPSPATVDSVVCVAADAMNLPPRALRPALLAAFSRAHQLGLTVQAVKAWLETEAKPPTSSETSA